MNLIRWAFYSLQVLPDGGRNGDRGYLIAHNENFWHNFFQTPFFFKLTLKIFEHNLNDPNSDTIQFKVVKAWNKRERNAPLELSFEQFMRV